MPESRLPEAISITSGHEDVITFMVESEEDLKSLLMKVKGQNEKAGLKQHSSNEDHVIQSHHFMGNRWGHSGNSDRLFS